jgi:uncharacterized protein YutE (UPF0331/DUF86 family)
VVQGLVFSAAPDEVIWRRPRDVFSLLARTQWLDALLAEQMKRMVGFRNVAVHGYQTLQIPIKDNIITLQLQAFIEFNKQVLRKACE